MKKKITLILWVVGVLITAFLVGLTIYQFSKTG